MEQKELIQVLASVRAGDDEAFSRLYALYVGMTEGVISSFPVTLCEADRAEASQEARLALYRAALTYRESKNVTFGLYARVCVRNAVVSFVRRRELSTHVALYDDEEMLLLTDGREPVSPLEEAERLGELMAEVGRVLSHYEAQIFSLLVDGETNAAIAERLGKSEKSVANAVFRIKSKLRDALGK